MKQRGLWLTLSNGQCATGLTYAVFRSKVLPKLKTKDIPRKKETAVLCYWRVLIWHLQEEPCRWTNRIRWRRYIRWKYD